MRQRLLNPFAPDSLLDENDGLRYQLSQIHGTELPVNARLEEVSGAKVESFRV
jgi:hypothetical protein